MKTRRSASTGFRGKRGPERGPVRKLADNIGVSRDWMYRALAIANMPEAEFEALVEGENPPGLAELHRIARGKRSKPEKAAHLVHVCPHCGGTL
jgi:hypothetical protein